MIKNVIVEIKGGDRIEVDFDILGSVVQSSKWRVIGRPELYVAVEKIKPQILGEISKIPVPQGFTPEWLLLKKLILQLRGEWGDDPSDPELCHCRKISQDVVERAIILGAHTVDKIRNRTSANTGCGTCLPELEDLLTKYQIPIS